MNVNRRWLGVSRERIWVLVAGAGLLASAGFVLGGSAHVLSLASRRPVDRSAGQSQDVQSIAATLTSASRESKQASLMQARSLFSGLPLMFEPNQGQANLDPSDPRVQFIARGSGYSLYLGSEGAIVNFGSARHADSFQMKLTGANANSAASGAELLPGKTNYLIGNNPAKWRTGIPQFARVRYEKLYPGIDLVFYGNQGRLEYDFEVAPGSDPSQADLEFEGAKRVTLDGGDLLLEGKGGTARLAAPVAYQEINGRRQPVNASFVLHNGRHARFAVGPYDRSRQLVIDPVLTFSTYFGGAGDERFNSIALDSAGNIYLAGSTTSNNLPILGGLPPNTLTGNPNVYIAKIQPPQLSISASLIYVTYLGGTGSDIPAGVAVDGAGDVFVAGTTTSTDFPTSAEGIAYQHSIESPSTGPQHVFATELNSSASLISYSTYLSGSGNDVASGMTIDAAGSIYVTGTTTSVETSPTDQFPASNLPNTLPFQTTSRLPGQLQFFVTKINPQAPGNSSVPYSTYFGGSNFAAPLVATGGGIAVDSNSNIYFTGTTNFTYTGCAGCSNTDFPILNAYQPCLNLPTVGIPSNPPSCTNTAGANSDAFVAKLNPNAVQGQQLQWSTYLGGTGVDSGTGVAVDLGAANVYLTGTTNSTDFTIPTTTGSFQPGPGGGNDAFVARFPNLTPSSAQINLSLGYFSYLGGTGDEAGLAIAADNNNGALVTGWTRSTNFPVFPPASQGCLIQCTLNGAQDAFAARINTVAATGASGNQTASWATYFGGNNLDEGTSIALDVNQNTYFAGDTNSTANLQVASPLPTTEGGGYQGGLDAFVTELRSAATISITGTPSLGTNQVYFWAGNPAQFSYTITNTGTDLASGLTLTDNLLSSPVSLTNAAGSVSGGSCSGASSTTSLTCPIGSLQAGSTTTITISVTPTASSDGSARAFNGGSVQVFGQNNIVLASTSVPANMSDFSMVVNPPDKSVPAAGQSATYQVQLTPHPVYGTNISLSCSGNPAGTTCGFSPSSVTLTGSGGATATLTISTTARPITTGSVRTIFGRYYAVWLAIPGLALIGAGRKGNRRRKILGVMFLGLVFAQLVPLPGCGGSNTQTPAAGTPSGNWPVTVTASSGSDSKSQGIHLIVP
ncbi:MAG TPA: SBBP repeat-containing protein [Candidatus Sulfotelmatobacter sp.]|nr:SBBP repeat-containing protein [Candidatus Sulfotelmatobacter sp.]